MVNSFSGGICLYPDQILCSCSVTLKVKKLLLTLKQNFLHFSSCPLPPGVSLDTTKEGLALSSVLPPSGVYTP